MSSELALNIDQISKTYHLYDQPKDRLKQMLLRGKRQYFREYQALKPVSFSLPKGEVLGVVGRNGAGKSTLLQLICGTLTPTTGQVTVQGRIAALLELGAGFNPQFTGRENIYLSASIMGISKQDVDQKIDDIIDFSGVRNFIDQPVSTYSSGMYVRLAFSVATSVEPDILIVDEALSVGDGDFARRSFERIMAMKERGATILFCSHSLYQIEVLCSSAIWLEKGQLIKTGTPAEIVPQYQAFLDCLAVDPDATPDDVGKRPIANDAANAALNPTASVSNQPEQASTPSPSTNEYARISNVVAKTGTAQGDQLDIVSGETDLTLDIRFQSTLRDEIPQVALTIHNAAGQLITSCGAWVAGVQPEVDANGNGRISVTFPAVALLKGTYYVGVLLFCQRGLFLHDEADPVVTLHVTQRNQERGIVMLPHTWHAQPHASKRLKEDAIVTKRQPSERWHVREATDDDFADIQRLFQDTFKQPLQAENWQWKYRYASSPGYLVSEGDEVVGFCGGAPRRALIKGEPATLAQLGDVMVDRRSRGVLTKTGPFYRSVYGFLTEKIGKGREFPYGFGFPNRRHLRVGERQNLYAATDRILEAKWTAQPQGDYQLRRWQGEPELGARINAEWQRMAPHVGDYLIGIRDQDWLTFRFLEKPNDHYQIYIVSSVDSADPLGVMVLKDHPDAGHMEWLDFIATPEHAPHILAAARNLAHQLGRERIQAWLSGNVYQWFESLDGEVEPTEVFVPGNALDDPEHLALSKGSWWLMGGDSDFR